MDLLKVLLDVFAPPKEKQNVLRDLLLYLPRKALLEFLDVVRARQGLQTENRGRCATGDLAKRVVYDGVMLAEIAARDSEAGEWFDYGQEKFLTEALRSLGRLRAWTPAAAEASAAAAAGASGGSGGGRASSGGAADPYEISLRLDDSPLDEQFVRRFLSDEDMSVQ